MIITQDPSIIQIALLLFFSSVVGLWGFIELKTYFSKKQHISTKVDEEKAVEDDIVDVGLQ